MLPHSLQEILPKEVKPYRDAFPGRQAIAMVVSPIILGSLTSFHFAQNPEKLILFSPKAIVLKCHCGLILAWPLKNPFKTMLKTSTTEPNTKTHFISASQGKSQDFFKKFPW